MTAPEALPEPDGYVPFFGEYYPSASLDEEVKTLGTARYTADHLQAYGDARAKAARMEATGWLPIESAPEGVLVVVSWRDQNDEWREDFDSLEDGCWMKHHNHWEHVQIIGGWGVPEKPPYTHYLQLPPPPEDSSALGGKGAAHAG